MQWVVIFSVLLEALPLFKKRKKVASDGGAASVRVAIDLSYEHLMNDKVIMILVALDPLHTHLRNLAMNEYLLLTHHLPPCSINVQDIAMLMKQCQRCYAMNRRTDTPLQVCNYQQQLVAYIFQELYTLLPHSHGIWTHHYILLCDVSLKSSCCTALVLITYVLHHD